VRQRKKDTEMKNGYFITLHLIKFNGGVNKKPPLIFIYSNKYKKQRLIPGKSNLGNGASVA
jgi:hypothetical protein